MWKPGPAPELRAGDVHVWRTRLDLAEASVQRLYTVLSEDERARAGRFHFERDRRRFVVARGTLRAVLGQYLRWPASGIRLCYEAHGKPYLASDADEPKFHFNVSHSNELALIGLCLDHRVGIDVEFKDPDRATIEVAKRFFAPEEVAALTDLAAAPQSDAFFAIWTMKEAYIKGRGEGVSLGLDTFAVRIGDKRSLGLMRSSHGPDEPARWRFWNIDAGRAYAAAMTVEGTGERRISYWDATAAEPCQ